MQYHNRVTFVRPGLIIRATTTNRIQRLSVQKRGKYGMKRMPSVIFQPEEFRTPFQHIKVVDGVSRQHTQSLASWSRERMLWHAPTALRSQQYDS